MVKDQASFVRNVKNIRQIILIVLFSIFSSINAADFVEIKKTPEKKVEVISSIDKIRKELLKEDIILEDKDGKTTWRIK